MGGGDKLAQGMREYPGYEGISGVRGNERLNIQGYDGRVYNGKVEGGGGGSATSHAVAEGLMAS